MSEQQFPHAQNQAYGSAGPQVAPPSQQQPAPAPARRSWFARHKILTGLGVLILLIVIVSVASNGGGSTGSGGGSSTAGGSSGSGTTAGIGTPVRDGKFEFTVTKMRCGVPSVGSGGLEQAAQGQFCLVSLKVSNIGDKPQTLDASSQFGYDVQGRKLSADGGAGIYANPAGGGAFLNDINPGNSATAVVVFDIPKTSKLTKVELHDSPFSGGVDVAVS